LAVGPPALADLGLSVGEPGGDVLEVEGGAEVAWALGFRDGFGEGFGLGDDVACAVGFTPGGAFAFWPCQDRAT
jgi:hypothetical protein